MAETKTLLTRLIIRNDTSANWTSVDPTLLKGELGIEIDTRKIKVGDGATAWTSLKYITGNIVTGTSAPSASATTEEIGTLYLNTSTNAIYMLVAKGEDSATWMGIADASTLSTLQSTVTSHTENTTSHITSAERTKWNKVITDLSTHSTGTTQHITSAERTQWNKTGTDLTSHTSNNEIHVTAEQKTTWSDGATKAGTAIQGIEVNGSAVSPDDDKVVNITVPTTASGISNTASGGISSTTVQGAINELDTEKAPKANPIFTGTVTLAKDPTSALQATTKQYVDNKITSAISASDAMVFKGTLGTGGTVTAVPTTGVVKGDTYKIITKGTYAGSACKIGDLIIALNSGSITANTTNWAYVPSGNENETSIAIATTGASPNISTTAQTGAITLGTASSKAYTNTKLTDSGSGDLPTGTAVASYVKAKTVDGVKLTGDNAIHFGTCGTTASTVAKVVTVANYTLITGSEVTVKFTVTNTASNPTLNVNGTGAKAIQYRGSAINTNYLASGRTYRFVYDGTAYQLIGDIDTDTNTDTGYTSVTVNNGLNSTGTSGRALKLGITSVSTDLLIQGSNTLILNGGDASL